VSFVSATALVSRIARQIGDPWRRRYMLVILLSGEWSRLPGRRARMHADVRRFQCAQPCRLFPV